VRSGSPLNIRSLLPRAAFAAFVAVGLSGCPKQARREQSVEVIRVPPARPESTLANSASARPAAPLRRSAQTLTGGDDAAYAQALIIAGTRTRFVFSGVKEDGQTVLQASGTLTDADKGIGDVLLQLDFKAEPNATWTRWVKPNERAALDARIGTLLQDRTRWADQILWWLSEAREPGRLLQQRKDDPVSPLLVPGRLVYTGHPLDVAFADAGHGPRHFLAVRDSAGRTAYARGGRLYVDENGKLSLNGGEVLGRLQLIPADADEVLIDGSGAVSAMVAGVKSDVGRLQIVSLRNFQRAGDLYLPRDDEPSAAEGAMLRTGHLEFPALDRDALIVALASVLCERRTLEDLQAALAHAAARPAPGVVNPAGGPAPRPGPVVIHADLPWTAEHLKLLGVNLERTPGRLTIAADNEPEALAAAAVKVMQVLRLRMNLHEQNLRNAERVRDSEGRLNPYRRKIVRIGEKGEPVEEVDNAALPKTYKPGDANADAEGFVVMPNVNKTVETTEFKAAADEYLLMRAVVQRIAPNHVFPDPPPLP
jgi:flagellar basal body rod protein FlgC